MVMPLLAQDDLAAARLRRMKLTATALLAAAASLYVLSLSFHGTAVGFLRSGAEAAMVGGLADWFAVTALFRRPLGLPIPHTGLVPRKKDELATKLGEFVTGHFLTREVVVEQVPQADVVSRLGRFLAEPEVADRLAVEVAFNAGVLLEALDEKAVVASALELLRRDQARRSYAPVLGRVLDRAIEGGTQRPLVDVVVSRSKTYLRAHREELVPQAREFVSHRGWLASLLVTDKRIRGVLDGLADTLEAVERDPQHPVRQWLDGLLRTFAAELQHDRHTAAKLDVLLARLLEDPQAQAALHDVIADAIVSIRESLADADGDLQQRIAGLICSLGSRAVHDAEFRGRIESVLEAVVGHAVDNYGDELTSLIRTQVARWDATSASQRIELAVGRDLQFIRINGTAVGAMAGLTIHAVTLALP
ncbi:MAG: hypothetical protein JWM02_3433 [Frankiales bacterium]|nr:hypothetical protein [Frankiales bacterium]